MTSTQFMLGFSALVGPWLVALMRRHNWSEDLVTVTAVLVSFACFIFGQFADGVLTWPLSGTFWLGLAGAYGLNQGGYALTKRVAPTALESVERL
jgi:hypothetical protein